MTTFNTIPRRINEKQKEHVLGDWTIQTTSETPEGGLHSITYGNGLFVAVGSYYSLINSTHSGRCITSPDGINWTTQNAEIFDGFYVNYNSIVYGKGLFVVIGSRVGTGYSSSFTSPDGINWTEQLLPVNGLGNITYANGLFIALSMYGSVTSPDGINWTQRVLPSNDAFTGGIAYGNGLFVAVASNKNAGTGCITSPDGINWTPREIPTNNYAYPDFPGWYSITYGNGLFVAVGLSQTGNDCMTSPDGINWTLQSTPIAYQWLAVTYGDGLFVALGFDWDTNVATCMTSSDGVEWTLQPVAADYDWCDIVYAKDKFVAVTWETTTQVMTATWGKQLNKRFNGFNFVSLPSGLGEYEQNSVVSITHGNGLFVATTSTMITTMVNYSEMLTSIDGIIWTRYLLDETNPGTPLAKAAKWKLSFGNGLFVAVSAGPGAIAASGRNIMTSSNGTTWTVQNSPQFPLTDVVFAKGLFVAIGYYIASPF